MPTRQTRTLQVHCEALPLLRGVTGLTAVSFSGEEGMNTLFRYEVVMATPEALDLHLLMLNQHAEERFLEEAELIGKPLTVAIELAPPPDWRPDEDRRNDPDPETREINGLITEACFLRREGRRLLYRFTLQPWLHAATLNQNCRIFQDMTVQEILRALLHPYAGVVVFKIYDSPPKRDFQVQYQESDFAFFSRLCEEWGYSYHFLHADGEHTLVVRDRWRKNPPNPGHAWRELEFHAPGHRFDSEYVHQLVCTTRLTSGDYVGSDYDYQHSRAGGAQHWNGDCKTMENAGPEIFDFQGLSHCAQAGTDVTRHPDDWRDTGVHLAKVRMDALRSGRQRARAGGHLRGMVPGHSFSLSKHPDRSANREYLILHTRLDIQETLQESHPTPLNGRDVFADETRPGQHHSIEVALELYPLDDGTPSYRPPARTPRPVIPGIQVARVVGPEGEQIHTDPLGRIKVHFPWDHTVLKNPSSSCWLRVMSFSASRQMGAIHLPRINDEVAVAFIGGDPDLPMVIGSSRNSEAPPPYPLPLGHALSGYRSHELGLNDMGNSHRHNMQILDDTQNGMQMLLGSDHATSQLSLGHITRITKNIGRQDHRGQGFELRTDHSGAIRAGTGLLISTEKRTAAAGIVLAITEPLQRVAAACEQHALLAGLASTAGAQQADADQHGVAGAIRQQHQEITGMETLVPRSEPATRPNMLLASGAGITATSTGATHLASGQDTAITTGGHTSISAGGSLLASAMGAIRLMAQKAGIRLVAALCDIDIQALQGKLRLLALVEISLVAGRITLSAKEEVVINGGGSTTRWGADGIESATSGPFQVRTTGLDLTGPRNQPFTFTTPAPGEAPEGTSPLVLSMLSFVKTGAELGNQPFRVLKGDEIVSTGVTNAEGLIYIDKHIVGTGEYTISTSTGNFILKVETELKDANEQQMGNVGFRHAKGNPKAMNTQGGGAAEARGKDYPDMP